MTRTLTANIGILILLAVIVSDVIVSPPNPYLQPAVFALGSGAASTGGFCGALPPQ